MDMVYVGVTLIFFALSWGLLALCEVPFTAQTRMSGVNLNGRQIRILVALRLA